jgi:4'-phosphopantetheinyl transferase EntD
VPRRPVLDGIVPSHVVAVERFSDEPDVPLFPAEQAAIARAVSKRRREFATVRHCARLGLGALGIEPVALVPRQRGAPAWPQGVVGSMTHCDGYRAAAVARSTEVRGLGIDAEPHGPLPEGVLNLVSRPAERIHLAALADAHPGVHWDRILFSAKESVYKAWFPLTSEWLGFDEAELSLDVDGGRFEATILKPAPAGIDLSSLNGRWVISDGLVVTAVVDAQP